VTAEYESQVAWRAIVRGEASPTQHVFDEGWLLNSRINDTDIICCNSSGTEDLSITDYLLEFSRFPNPAMSILVLIPRKPAPELEQR
jgi:hypothetical protein